MARGRRKPNTVNAGLSRKRRYGFNNQYHNYHCLFNKWFGNDIDYQNNRISNSVLVLRMKAMVCLNFWEHFKNK